LSLEESPKYDPGRDAALLLEKATKTGVFCII
jgi:hypothetical protein